MSIGPGTRLGPYEIVAALGAGGMGEVYRARDTRLDRDVAIKVLPDAFAEDGDRLARFEREAKVLASLNHPNIAQVFGFEDRAIVMELVEGPTLAELIGDGHPEVASIGERPREGDSAAGRGGGAPRGLSLDDALPIARQIADALVAAHEQGIVHRDLKPANVKVRHDGSVKVLDFGLAKALGPDPSEASASSVAMNSPTLTARATQLGMILGTAAYMAPEQAKGRPVDRRADVWAFGVVLFEMLAGRRAFDGDDISEVLASVLKLEPNWDALPADLPPSVRRLLRRCLEKDPKKRLRDVGEGMLQLDDALASGSTTSMVGDVGAAVAAAAAAAPMPLWRRALPLAATAVATAAVVTGAYLFLRQAAAPAEVVQFSYTPSAGSEFMRSTYAPHELAISPDGRTLVWVAAGKGGIDLRLGRFDGSGSSQLRGAEDAIGPFVSPANDWVGFVNGQNQRALVKVAIQGGAAVSLATAPSGIYGATWAADGTIIFGTAGGGLFTVPDGGGEPATLTTPDPALGEQRHIWPSAIPGTSAVLFVVHGGGRAPLNGGQLAVLDRKSGRIARLNVTGTFPRYAPSGHIVYATADGSIAAVPFDVSRLEVTGNPVPIVQGVTVKSSGAADFDLASDGRLVYAASGAAGGIERTLSWVDLKGKETPVASAKRSYVYARVSRDMRLSLDIRDQEQDVWILETRGTLTRLTSSEGQDQYGLWMPDDKRVILYSGAAGDHKTGLYAVQADGTGTSELLYEPPAGGSSPFPNTISPDGKAVVFRTASKGKNDLFVLNLDGDRIAKPLVATEHDELNAAFSPDGRWIAYQSDLSGRYEVYARPYPDATTQVTLSTSGGFKPVWSPSGRDVYYVTADGKMMSVAVDTTRGFTAAAPVELFDASAYYLGSIGRNYDVAPDGKRFIMIRDTAGDQATQSLTVILNWTEELRRRAPAKR